MKKEREGERRKGGRLKGGRGIRCEKRGWYGEWGGDGKGGIGKGGKEER